MAGKKRTTFQKIRRYTFLSLLWFVGLSVLWVLIYKWVNPPGTMIMLSRKMGAESSSFKLKHDWVDIEKISPNLQLALIVGEDQRYTEHWGFDFKAIEKAVEINKEGKKKVGASTISQQCAKNIFLWEGRSWLRKGLEAWFTMLIEFIWGKKRIMEVYLNMIEMGNGVFGAEAAAKNYYGVSASNLSANQAAKIASIVPCPRTCGMNSYYSNARTNMLLYGMRVFGIELKYLK